MIGSRLRRGLLAAVAASVLAAPVSAEQSDDEALARFIAGNTLFTLYHEIGHALVHLLDLPVLGREEDAVDGFAAMIMIPETEDEFADDLVIAAADGWALIYEEEQSGGEGAAYWGEHSLDIQRFYALGCLIYGSDPDGFTDYADDIELPAERRERCEEDYARTLDTWGKLLANHRGPGRRDFQLEFQPARGDAAREAAAFLKESEIVQAAVAGIDDLVTLPSSVKVSFATCGEPSAYYDPAPRAVTFCYELVDYFGQLGADAP